MRTVRSYLGTALFPKMYLSHHVKILEETVSIGRKIGNLCGNQLFPSTGVGLSAMSDSVARIINCKAPAHWLRSGASAA